jgi:hypothetical protein
VNVVRERAGKVQINLGPVYVRVPHEKRARDIRNDVTINKHLNVFTLHLKRSHLESRTVLHCGNDLVAVRRKRKKKKEKRKVLAGREPGAAAKKVVDDRMGVSELQEGLVQ